jgi:nucleoside diphosphate kinase
MILSRENAIEGWREVIGPVDPEKAKLENPNS